MVDKRTAVNKTNQKGFKQKVIEEEQKGRSDPGQVREK